MSIRTKAWLLITVVTVLVAAICFDSVISLKRISEIDRQAKVLTQINIHLLECRRQEKNFQLRGFTRHGEDTLNSAEKWKKLLEKALDLVKKSQDELNDRYPSQLASINQDMMDYGKIFWMQVEKSDIQDWDVSLDNDVVKKARSCQAMILKIQDLEELRKGTIMRQSEMLIYMLGVLVVIALAAFGYFLMINLVRPVVDLAHMLKEISSREGNLTLRLSVRQKDEIGDLANGFNVFVEAIQNIIKDVSSNIKILAVSSEHLDDISTGLKVNAEMTSNKSMAMTAAGIQMNTNMDYITTASLETNASIEQMVLATENMSSNVKDIARNAEQARTVSGLAVAKTRKASAQILELENSAKDISKVTEVITEISEQTNLLALNATIEAARAGTTGQGFAVVANEIKTLARQTADATQDIKNSIQRVQHTTVSTSEEIQQVSEIISEIDDIVSSIASSMEEQALTTQTVLQDLQVASGKIHGMNENLNQSAHATKEMSRNIDEVDNAAKEISETASQVSSSSEDLAELSMKLKNIMDRLRT